MLTKPTITDKGQILCPIHNQDLKYYRIYFSLFFKKAEMLCDGCVESSGVKSNLTEARFQTNSSKDFLSISLQGVPQPVTNLLAKSVKTEIMNSQLEHIIQDYKSQGFAPRNLIYVPAHNALISCGINGTVIAWKITDDSVEMLDEFKVEGTIRCAKHFCAGGGYPTYLALGVNQDLHIYSIDRDVKFSFLKKIEYGSDINDIEVLEKEQKMYVVGWSNLIRLYDLKDFSLENSIDVAPYRANFPICTVIYVEKQNALAIEDKVGIYIVPLNKDSDTNAKPLRYQIHFRRGTGLGYLPKSEKFLFRSDKSGIQIIDANDLTLKSEFQGKFGSTEVPGFRFVANEDETEIISNTNSPDFALYNLALKNSYRVSLQNSAKQSATVEILQGHNRVAVADQFTGTILIYRTNLAQRPNSAYFCSNLIDKSIVNPIPTTVTSGMVPFSFKPVLSTKVYSNGLNKPFSSFSQVNLNTVPPPKPIFISPKPLLNLTGGRLLRKRTQTQPLAQKAPKVSKTKVLFKKQKPTKTTRRKVAIKKTESQGQAKRKRYTKTKKTIGKNRSTKKLMDIKITLDTKILSRSAITSKGIHIGDEEKVSRKKERKQSKERRGRRKISEEREEKNQSTRKTMSRSRSSTNESKSKEKIGRSNRKTSASKRASSPNPALGYSRKTRSSSRRSSEA